MTQSNPNLRKLLAAAKQGEGGSLGQLLEHYRNYLYLVARTQIDLHLAVRASPSDVVQETFLQATKEFAAFRGQGEGELITWLRRILASRIVKAYERHPHIADELEENFHKLDALHAAATGLAGADVSFASFVGEVGGAPREIGDFRILRELGRGGMGIVYEAEQLSLTRKVALKVLPFAALLDKRQLARFQNEARAAATLAQPNIVPVHAVGEDRGVHYYAMQLVRGQSLAEAIEQMRNADCGLRNDEASSQSAIDTQPLAALATERSTNPRAYFRRVAELGIEIAKALDHAHEHGVVHRDVKPANLLQDQSGKLYITDFGLIQLTSSAPDCSRNSRACVRTGRVSGPWHSGGMHVR